MSAATDDLARFSCQMTDSDRGHILIANKNLKPGHLVISNQPYARTLRPALWSDRCFQCMETLPPQGIKSSCIWYCSNRCQQIDYLLHHQVEGPILESLRTNIASDDVLSDMILVARTLRRTYSNGSQDQLYASFHSGSFGPKPIVSTADDVRALVYHEPEDMSPVTSVAQNVINAGLLGEYKSKITVQEVAKTLLCFGCNNFAVTNKLLVTIGSGVCPAGAILNHACSPNVVVTWNSKTGAQEIRCCRAVKAGEELTHSYTDAAMPTEERRHKLRGEYGFMCGCNRCVTPMLTQLAPSFRMELKMAARALSTAAKGTEKGTAKGTATATTDASNVALATQVNEMSDKVDYEWNVDNCMRGDLLGNPIIVSHQAATNVELSRNKDIATARTLLEQSIATSSDADQMVLLKQASALYAKWLHPLHLDRLKVGFESVPFGLLAIYL